MFSSGENYRSEVAAATTTHGMSVAAKAGEMQIFSGDILGQMNGISRRTTQKQALRQGKTYSSHTNDHRLNKTHIERHMNHANERSLAMESNSIGHANLGPDPSSPRNMSQQPTIAEKQ